MKRLLGSAALLLLLANTVFAQGVGINATGAAADTSAILDLSATNKGFLPPRMTAAQRAAIVQPATGLLVYQTDGTQGLYYNAGTSVAPSWKQVLDASAAGTQPWTVNGAHVNYAPGNVGIQRTTPLARLDVLGGNWDVVGGEGDVRIGDGTTRLKFGIATGGGGTGAATIMEQGPVGAYNVLALGSQGNKVAFVNGATQRFGIGTDAPNAPLGFAATGGKKITLYPGLTGDYGLGISAGRLFLTTEAAGTDIALGYDNGGTFVERFAFKTNGAMAVNGAAGAAGQVLQSNGASASPAWVNPTHSAYGNFYTIADQSVGTYAIGYPAVVLPNMTGSFTTTGNARAVMTFSAEIYSASCFACGSATATLELLLDGTIVRQLWAGVANGAIQTCSGAATVNVGAGVHTVQLRLYGVSGTPLQVGSGGTARMNNIQVQVIPE